MRTGLIAFAVIVLVLGGLLYFVPTQTAQATTTTIGETTDTRTSFATVTVPIVWTYTVLIAGLILLVLGFALPGPRVEVKRTSGHSSMRMKEQIEDDDGHKRTVVRHEEREE